MKFIIATAIALNLLVIALGYIDDYGDTVERGNAFVDKLLRDMVQEHGDEYDPYVIEDSVIGFHRKIIVNISGEAKLHDGYIRGLKSLHRADDCYLKDENERLRIRADMGAGVLDLHYAGSVKFMNFGPTIEVHGKVPYIEVVMEMTVNSNDGKEGHLEKFYIEDIRGMQVWITGLGPLNWAVNTLISAVTSIFQRFMYRAVEHKIEKHISDRIKNYEFPVTDTTTLEPTVTETTVESTEAKSTEMETATEEITTASEKETVEPTTEKETVELTTEEETEEPTTEEETVKPTTEEETLEPTTEEETVNPTTEEETVKPTTEEETVEPTSEKETVEPTTEEVTIQPSTEEETVKLTTEEETVEPTTEEVTVEPTTEEITVEPTTEEETVEQITGEEEDLKPKPDEDEEISESKTERITEENIVETEIVTQEATTEAEITDQEDETKPEEETMELKEETTV